MAFLVARWCTYWEKSRFDARKERDCKGCHFR